MQHVENEIKLRVPNRFDLRRLCAESNGFTVSPPQARRLNTVYYDSDDLRLLRWGCSLRHRRGEGWTLKLPGVARNSGLTRHEHTFPDEGNKVPAAALELATAYLRGKPVGPVSRLRTVRKATNVLGVDGAELAEIVDDDVRVIEDGHVARRFREVEVELREAAPSALLDELVAWLQDLGAGKVDNTPKLVRSLGTKTPDSEIPEVEAGPASSASKIVQQALSASVARLLREDPTVRTATTAEAVHQMRVATRRLRSDLRTFLPLLQHDWACGLRDRLKWIADELGLVRDADVLSAGLVQHAADLAPLDHAAARELLQHFTEAARQSRTRLLAALREPRYVQLLDELVEAAEQPKFLPKADSPAQSVLPDLMHDPWKILCEAIERVEKDASFDQLHQARIKAKRFRYACEAVEPIAGKKAKKFATKVEKLQKVLGEFHDAVVMQQQLRDYQGSPRALFVAGELSAKAAADAEKARCGWPDVWKKASKKKSRFWI